MFSAMCKDQFGNLVGRLMQWDLNQTLHIAVGELQFPEPPVVHFCHEGDQTVLAVQSTMENGDIIVNIPNDLLRTPGNIIAYLFLISGESYRTVKLIQIPVKPRPKPPEYFYTDNVEIIFFQDLVELVQQLKVDLENAETIWTANETARENAETERQTQEEQRQSAEDDRTAKESARASEESARVTAETARADAETVRCSQENIRIENEQSRTDAESLRGASEAERIENERSREDSERAREQAESSRAQAESLRDTQESERIQAESLRQENETKRTDATNAAVKQCNDTVADIQAMLANGDFIGETGADGTTYTPHVAEDGTLSWTNASGLENPAPVNIKGEKGVDGTVSFDDLTPAQKASLVDLKSLALVYTESSTLSTLQSGETLDVAFGKMKLAIDLLLSHTADTNNPHQTTLEQLGSSGVANAEETKEYLKI